MLLNSPDTITAVASGKGGAIGVIRVSGQQAIEICDRIFRPASGKPLKEAKGYTLHYGEIVAHEESTEGTDSCPSEHVIDDVIVSLFRAPRSYTGEDMVEISCHSSRYIEQEIIRQLIRQGARPAEAGEFTIRAFLAGKMDLSQAEAVADMIASVDRATHALALNQMRGGYSSDFTELRQQLIDLASLLELELDFGEEDVEFADRAQLGKLLDQALDKTRTLLQSFGLGNAIKEGVGVAIIGSPNAGKSTLLNALVKDDRAMVSDIAGTTRDVIEESINLEGITFRFIDTAGIRKTEDRLEQMGIERTISAAGKAHVILLLVEAGTPETMLAAIQQNTACISLQADQHLCLIINKSDLANNLPENTATLQTLLAANTNIVPEAILTLSAKTGRNLEQLLNWLSTLFDTKDIYTGVTVVSNSRHYEALYRAEEALCRTQTGLQNGLAADLVVQDLREAIFHIGLVTNVVSNNDILNNIFSKFCIGK